MRGHEEVQEPEERGGNKLGKKGQAGGGGSGLQMAPSKCVKSVSGIFECIWDLSTNSYAPSVSVGSCS
jgi:hypothetical protein